MRKRFAIFISGSGTNMVNILKAVKRGDIKADPVLVFSDKPKALGLQKAGKYKVDTLSLELKNYESKIIYEKAIMKELGKRKVDFIVLAGYMKILGPTIIKAYRRKILNIHPALLPSFKGAHGIKDAFDYGVKIAGVTVHFVDEEIDHGPIILQKEVAIKESDTLESLEKRVHKAEYEIYPKAIQLFALEKIKVKGRKVVYV